MTSNSKLSRTSSCSSSSSKKTKLGKRKHSEFKLQSEIADDGGYIGFELPPSPKRNKLRSDAQQKAYASARKRDLTRAKSYKKKLLLKKKDEVEQTVKPRQRKPGTARTTFLRRVYVDLARDEPDNLHVKYAPSRVAATIQVRNLIECRSDEPEDKQYSKLSGTVRRGVDLHKAVQLACELNNDFELCREIKQLGNQHPSYIKYKQKLDALLAHGDITVEQKEYFRKASKLLLKIICGTHPLVDDDCNQYYFDIDALQNKLSSSYRALYCADKNDAGVDGKNSNGAGADDNNSNGADADDNNSNADDNNSNADDKAENNSNADDKADKVEELWWSRVIGVKEYKAQSSTLDTLIKSSVKNIDKLLKKVDVTDNKKKICITNVAVSVSLEPDDHDNELGDNAPNDEQ